MRECIVTDMSKASIVLSVWKNNIKRNLEDKKCHTFTNISLRDYIVTKKTITPTTVIRPLDSIDISKMIWDAIDMTDFSKIESDAK